MKFIDRPINRGQEEITLQQAIQNGKLITNNNEAVFRLEYFFHFKPELLISVGSDFKAEFTTNDSLTLNNVCGFYMQQVFEKCFNDDVAFDANLTYHLTISDEVLYTLIVYKGDLTIVDGHVGNADCQVAMTIETLGAYLRYKVLDNSQKVLNQVPEELIYCHSESAASIVEMSDAEISLVAGGSCGANSCGENGCGSNGSGPSVCGADGCGGNTCGQDAGGGNACSADGCAANACGVDACGIDGCGANICAIDACVMDGTPINGCAMDACIIDILPTPIWTINN